MASSLFEDVADPLDGGGSSGDHELGAAVRVQVCQYPGFNFGEMRVTIDTNMVTDTGQSHVLQCLDGF